jgi:hypothetical protein
LVHSEAQKPRRSVSVINHPVLRRGLYIWRYVSLHIGIYRYLSVYMARWWGVAVIDHPVLRRSLYIGMYGDIYHVSVYKRLIYRYIRRYIDTWGTGAWVLWLRSERVLNSRIEPEFASSAAAGRGTCDISVHIVKYLYIGKIIDYISVEYERSQLLPAAHLYINKLILLIN